MSTAEPQARRSKSLSVQSDNHADQSSRARSKAREEQRTQQEEQSERREQQRAQKRVDDAQRKTAKNQQRERQRRRREEQRLLEEERLAAWREQRAQDGRLHGNRHGSADEQDYLDPNDPKGSGDRIGQKLFEENFDPKDPQRSLKKQVSQAGRVYMDSLKHQGLLSHFFAEDEPRPEKRMSELHEAYCGVMVYTALAPLKQGVKTSTVMEAVGAAAAMWALSPEFRDHVSGKLDEYRQKIDDGVSEQIRRRRNSKWEKTSAQYSQEAEKAARAGKPLSQKWEDRLNATYEKAMGRPMYTAESAALTEMALAESMYDDLRNPDVLGDDPQTAREEIKARHEALMGQLYSDAYADGIEPEELATAGRVLAGQQAQLHPEKAALYSELGSGKFTMTPPITKTLKNGQKAQIWDGGFQNTVGERITEGAFTVREPMTKEEHRAEMSDVMTAELSQARDIDDLSARMMSYCAGSSTDVADEMLRHTDGATHDILSTTRTMGYSMDDDGLSREDQRWAYNGAFADAINDLPRVNPDLAMQWADKYGMTMLDEMQQAMEDESRLKAAMNKHVQPRADDFSQETPSAGYTGQQKEQNTQAHTQSSTEPEFI